MGETYRTFYSDGFPYDYMRLLTGTTAYTQFPNAPGYMFKFKAHSSNIGSFFFGFMTGTTPFPLEMNAGDDSGWFKVAGDNLNRFYFYNLSGSSEVMMYWVQH